MEEDDAPCGHGPCAPEHDQAAHDLHVRVDLHHGVTGRVDRGPAAGVESYSDDSRDEAGDQNDRTSHATQTKLRLRLARLLVADLEVPKADGPLDRGPREDVDGCAGTGWDGAAEDERDGNQAHAAPCVDAAPLVRDVTVRQGCNEGKSGQATHVIAASDERPALMRDRLTATLARLAANPTPSQAEGAIDVLARPGRHPPHAPGVSRMKRVCLAVLGAFAASCGPSADRQANAAGAPITQPALAGEARAAAHADLRRVLFDMDAVHSRLIATLGPVQGLLELADPQLTLLVAGQPILRGHAAARAALESLYPPATRPVLTRALAGGEVSADGQLGFTFGWITLTGAAAAGAPAATHGTYTAVWRGGDDGLKVVAYFTRSAAADHGPPRAGFPLLAEAPGLAGAVLPGDAPELAAYVLATDAAFAALSAAEGTSIAFPAYAAEDLLIMGGRDHLYLRGGSEIVDLFAGWTPEETLAWRPLVAGVAPSGDLAYSIGTATDTYADASGSTSYDSKYLTLWLRQPDGSWRFIGDGGAASPASSESQHPR
jgi:ketosteroid isomerase-like protein